MARPSAFWLGRGLVRSMQGPVWPSEQISLVRVARHSPAAILAAMEREQAVIDRWSGAAPFWEKHRETIRQMFAPVTQALIENAWIARGQTVLDVATGPGEPALSIA